MGVPKLTARMKTWSGNVHVVVLGNEEPDFDKMTADRYNVSNI